MDGGGQGGGRCAWDVSRAMRVGREQSRAVGYLQADYVTFRNHDLRPEEGAERRQQRADACDPHDERPVETTKVPNLT